jgi:two-component system sporulation sensor kinase A
LSFIIRHNPELVPEVVDNLDNSIELMMNTLEEMKEITNPTEPDKSLTDIYQVLKAAIDLSNIPDKIELISDFDEDFLAINVDKEKIQRVFFNIIRNAIEAMPKGGKITIEHNVKNGYIEFFLTDTGSGIPDEVLDQIFQPFFSTKPQSLGLGLSFCKLAVESNGGSISINSEVGVGTTVILRLPV